MGQKTPPLQPASTGYFSMDDDGDVLAARRTLLAEVRPQRGGSAAHRGADHRDLRARAGSRCSSAAAGGTGGGIHADARHCDPGAGYRSAQSAGGRTVGGSADGVVLHSTARFVEQDVDIPVPGGGLHVLPDPGGSSSSAVSRVERGEGFFRTFHRVKKSPKSAASPSPKVPARSKSSSWTSAAYEAKESLSASEFEYIQYNDGSRASGFRLGVAMLGGSSMTRMGP